MQKINTNKLFIKHMKQLIINELLMPDKNKKF